MSTETEDEEKSQDRKLLERFNHLYHDNDSSVRHQGRDRRSFCGRLELLSTPPQQSVDKKRSPDNIILSKTVRKAKREQRHKREMSCDRWTTSGDETSPTSTKSTASLHSPTYSTSQTYLTTRYRDLTVKTPYFVDPSSDQVLIFSNIANFTGMVKAVVSFFWNWNELTIFVHSLFTGWQDAVR